MKNILYFLSFLAFSAVFSACNKDETLTGTNTLNIHFESRAGDQALVLGQAYVTANGDTVRFSTFNYYVSNFVLVKSDGTTYTVPQDSCYFLIQQSDPESQEIELRNIPAGDYTGVRFVIGVDSAKCAAPVAERTGALDPATAAQGMYWTWNSGYIFVKVEGTSPQAPVDPMVNDRVFYYHIGGFGGYNTPTINNIKTQDLVLPENAELRSDVSPEIHTYVDVLEVFKTPTTINVATDPVVMFNQFSTTISSNYSDMFRIDHVHN